MEELSVPGYPEVISSTPLALASSQHALDKPALPVLPYVALPRGQCPELRTWESLGCPRPHTSQQGAGGRARPREGGDPCR